jgi:hypothetical protein
LKKRRGRGDLDWLRNRTQFELEVDARRLIRADLRLDAAFLKPFASASTR